MQRLRRVRDARWSNGVTLLSHGIPVQLQFTLDTKTKTLPQEADPNGQALPPQTARMQA
jgi:hypothetical protein